MSCVGENRGAKGSREREGEMSDWESIHEREREGWRKHLPCEGCAMARVKNWVRWSLTFCEYGAFLALGITLVLLGKRRASV